MIPDAPGTDGINPDDFLTSEERSQLQRLLSDPSEFPREFGAWINAYIAINGEVGRSQVVGLQRFTAKQAVASQTGGATTSSSYGDLSPNYGPSLRGLSKGTYLVMYGAIMAAQVAGKTCFMSVDVNGAGATDANGVSYYNGPGPSFGSASMMRALLLDLTKPSNTLATKYRSQDATSCVFNNPWIIALRVA